MIKQFILLLNFIGLFLVHWFAGNVTIDETAPTSAKAGSEFTVTIKINKGTTSGFARFQDELPEGFTATPLETKTADFRFESQKVKFIWTSLPSDAEFEVSYKVTVANNISGDKTINSKFSFIADNASQSITASHNIHIDADPNATPVVTNNTGNDTGNNTGNNNPNTAGTNTVTPKDSAKPAAVVSGFRVVPTDAVQGEFQVDIHLNKGSITGFAKMEEELPAGFTATPITTANADFKFDKQKVKFIWVSLPSSDKEIVLSYKVTLDPGVNGQQVIKGLFSYIEGETPKQFAPEGSFLNVKGTPGANPIVSNGNPDTNNGNNNAGNNTTGGDNTNTGNGNTTGGNTVAGNNTGNGNNTTGNTTGGNNTTGNATDPTSHNPIGKDPATIVSTTPNPQNGVVFKVQIMALHRSIDDSYFAKSYNITERIDHDMHEGWTKYIVATKGYTEYKDARDYREVMRSKGVVAPFVTAYNSGKRITTLDALMINHQTWVR